MFILRTILYGTWTDMYSDIYRKLRAFTKTKQKSTSIQYFIGNQTTTSTYSMFVF